MTSVRAALIRGASAIACALPEPPLVALAEGAGELWYRTTPARAARARRNLRRVAEACAREGRGSALAAICWYRLGQGSPLAMTCWSSWATGWLWSRNSQDVRLASSSYAYRDVTGATEPTTVLTFRSSGDELLALVHAGPPFYRPPWSPTVIGMVLDDDTDWAEVTELVTESYRFCAPQKLVRLLDER